MQMVSVDGLGGSRPARSGTHWFGLLLMPRWTRRGDSRRGRGHLCDAAATRRFERWGPAGMVGWSGRVRNQAVCAARV